MALLGLIAANLMPKAANMFRVSVQSSVRRFGSMVRYTYDQAILTNRLHRIVLNLDEQTWSVEVAPEGELPIDRTRRELSPFAKLGRSSSLDKKDGDDEGLSFSKAKGNLTGPLPKGVQIVEVKSWRVGKTPTKKGQVSIYAYPNGLIDEATVSFSELGKAEVQKFDVEIQPLTGRVKIAAGKTP